MLPPIQTRINKRTDQSAQMQGINLTDAYADWQMESCKGISTRRYPYITTADKLTPVDVGISEGFHAVSMYPWEKLFVVTDEPSEDGGYKCFYGGEYCGDAVNLKLPKQYAIVGNKLCMFPDKVMFNINEENILSTSMNTAPELQYIRTGTVEYRKAVGN